jgi:hypothetical protein
VVVHEVDDASGTHFEKQAGYSRKHGGSREITLYIHARFKLKSRTIYDNKVSRQLLRGARRL